MCFAREGQWFHQASFLVEVWQVMLRTRHKPEKLQYRPQKVYNLGNEKQQ
jgi:hypothetical protein